MSLAKYKRDKITEALLDKGYQRHPELDLSLKYLWNKLHDEEIKLELNPIMINWITFDELISMEEGIEKRYTFKYLGWVPEKEDFIKLKRELADVSNMIDFIFDRVMVLEEKLRELKQ